MRNLVTDVAGVRVGNAEDARVRTGVTAVVFERPVVASVDVRGGAPGTRDTELLAPERTVEAVDAIVLSGGSAFGLAAGDGALAALAAQGRGFAIGPARVPIVPTAILFDLANGGDKSEAPYGRLGAEAVAAAAETFALGTAGAGYGATTADLKGGLGSASVLVGGGATVGAIVAVNAVGTATMGGRPYFWASPFEVEAEFGGKGWPARVTDEMLRLRLKGAPPGGATTLAVVVTDATLAKAQCRHLAIMAQAGLARALHPAHAPLDGDTVFAAATAGRPDAISHRELTELGAAAAVVLARAIARGVYEAATDDRGAATAPAYKSVWTT
jgi:L-aminopeptidase/D-esterase-like protein